MYEEKECTRKVFQAIENYLTVSNFIGLLYVSTLCKSHEDAVAAHYVVKNVFISTRSVSDQTWTAASDDRY